MSKESLRKTYDLKEEIPETMNLKIIEIVSDFLNRFDHIEIVGIYIPLFNELDIMSLMIKFPNKKFAIPKIHDQSIYFVTYSLGDRLESCDKYPSYYQPASDNSVIPELAFIPAIAFDLRGYRLGRGKGHYDRYLSNNNLIKVGICRNNKLITYMPNELHDIKMDYIITEDIILDL
ncbi:MAG UNVERIFIED_CONTAM: 5-formyltetrahydrofolate cyclo-ligase [Rickettsiaceae bacterium]|jgi:5-formyltetrahydrofolate cyclo-ligase